MVLLHVENAKSPYRILDTDFLFSKVGRYAINIVCTAMPFIETEVCRNLTLNLFIV